MSTKAKEDPSPLEKRLSPTRHQPSISWSWGLLLLLLLLLSSSSKSVLQKAQIQLNFNINTITFLGETIPHAPSLMTYIYCLPTTPPSQLINNLS